MKHSPFGRWTPLALPSLFFLAVIYYEELVLKVVCFGEVPLSGALFTLLFSLPIALVLGLICAALSPSWGRSALVALTALLSLWMGAQIIYYRLFKTYITLFSLTKMLMVAQSFGGSILTTAAANWFVVVLMACPVLVAYRLRRVLLPGLEVPKGTRGRWVAGAVALQLAAMGLVMLSGDGVISLRYIYTQTATPDLEAQYFGMLTQTQLEVRRLIFGIDPDDPDQRRQIKWTGALPDKPWLQDPQDFLYTPDKYHVVEIDFDTLMAEETDPDLMEAHRWFQLRQPTEKNEWTGRFAGKNLVWIVAEGFSTLALDPERTPTLWKLSHEGILCDNFYTPLWGVSTSDGEYTTTTGLVPKSGEWSYSQSAENYMPFSLGSLLRQEGYRTMAFHNYLYDYYDRNLSHPNMGYEYIAMGQGLTRKDLIPQQYLADQESFPPSDRMMMDKIVPMFVQEDRFMAYCLTVSGHLYYTREENIMSDLHWDRVKDLPYSDPVKCYLASQLELELAVTSLVDQLEGAGKLEDTVIVLSGDHYPYGLTDEEYSELLGHPVDPVFEIFENTLILWSADLEEPVHVDKYCSSLDIMPTLANLFGLEFDARLIMGEDIFSRRPGLVIFSNYSFLHDQGWYNSVTDQFVRWDAQEPDPDSVANLVAEVQNRVAYSAVILDYDYFRLALEKREEQVK